VAKLSSLRGASVALAGAAVYCALLWLLYAKAPYAAIPHWWRHFAPNGPVALVIWFSLLNVGGAILAAVPVAFGLVLGLKVHRFAFGLAIGVVPAAYIVAGGLIEFGVPARVEAWVVEITQFFAVGLAVVAMVALIQGFPLIIASSDRKAGTSANQGENR
jgi:hypothetical protein